MNTSHWSLVFWSLLGCLWSGLALADELEVQIHEVFAIVNPGIKVIAEVSEASSGQPAQDVTAEDVEKGFTIKGADLEFNDVLRFEDSEEDFGTVILIDGSHSMHDDKDDVRRAVQGFINGMGPNDLAMVAVFNEPSENTKGPVVYGLETGWLRDKGQLRTHLDEIMEIDFQRKYTLLNQALNETIQVMADSDVAILKGILLLSDGADSLPERWSDQQRWTYKQEYPSTKAPKRAKEASVRVSSVFYKSDPIEHSRVVLEDLAIETGGSLTDANNSAQILQRFNEAQERIHKLWVLQLTTGELGQGQEYTAKLRIDAGEDTAVGTKIFQIKTPWKGSDELDSTEVVLSQDLREEGEEKAEAITEESKEETKTMLYALLGLGVGLVLLIFIVGRMQGKKRKVAEHTAMEAHQEARAAQQAALVAADQARAAEERAQLAQDEAAALTERSNDETSLEGDAAALGPNDLAAPKRPRKTMFSTPSSEKAVLLTVLEGGEVNSQIDVFSATSNPVVRVGTDPARVDLVLTHQTISGHHCNFTRNAQGRVIVEDIGSANGTWIDGQDIRGAGPVDLSPGQQIHFGLLKTWYTS